MKIKNTTKKAYSLSELLIGILLAAIVSEMAFKMLGNMINTDEYEKNMVTMQADINHVSEMVSSDLKKAGLFLNDNTNNQPFDWTRTNDGGGGNDSISVVYQNINNEFNCSGILEMPNINNHYYVADNDLYCNNILILSNVISFQLLFGIDLNEDNIIDRYLNADQAESFSIDTNYTVLDVKFDITVESEREFTSAYEKTIFTSSSGNTTYNNGKIYRNITRSTVLKNML
jgi:hypothetical protein